MIFHFLKFIIPWFRTVSNCQTRHALVGRGCWCCKWATIDSAALKWKSSLPLSVPGTSDRVRRHVPCVLSLTLVCCLCLFLFEFSLYFPSPSFLCHKKIGFSLLKMVGAKGKTKNETDCEQNSQRTEDDRPFPLVLYSFMLIFQIIYTYWFLSNCISIGLNRLFYIYSCIWSGSLRAKIFDFWVGLLIASGASFSLSNSLDFHWQNFDISPKPFFELNSMILHG